MIQDLENFKFDSLDYDPLEQGHSQVMPIHSISLNNKTRNYKVQGTQETINETNEELNETDLSPGNNISELSPLSPPM